MNDEYSYIFYTFFKNLPDASLKFITCRVNSGKYGQRYKYGQRATNAHMKASLGCNSKASISPIICTFGFLANCILLDSVPLKQHDIPVHSDHPYFTVPICENLKERAGLTQTILLHALWYFD